MANIKSQKKRNRQNEKSRLRNKARLAELRTSIKKVEAAVEAGEPTDELVRMAQRSIDTAVAEGVLHENNAARKKSLLARRVSAG